MTDFMPILTLTGAAVFALLSLWNRAFLFCACVCFWVSDVHPVLWLTYGLLLSFLDRKRFRGVPHWTPRAILSLMLGMAFLLTMVMDLGLKVDQWVMVLMPFCFFMPVLKVLDNHSSAMKIFLPCVILAVVSMFMKPFDALSLTWLCLLGIHHLGYRNMPVVLKAVLFIVTASLCVGLWLSGAVEMLGLLLLAFVLFQLEKVTWIANRCTSSLTAWLSVLLVTAALMIGGNAISVPLHAVCAYVLIVLSQQESCRTCLIDMRCREQVLSHFGKSAILFYGLYVYLGNQPSLIHSYVFIFIWLCLEMSRLKTLKPVQLEALPENPCREEALAKQIC